MENQKSKSVPRGWVCISLGDVARVRNGFAFKSSDFCDNGTPLIRQGDLREGAISAKTEKFVPTNFLTTHRQWVVQRGDLLIGMSGSLGALAEYVSETPALQNQRTGLLSISSLVDPGWIRFSYELLKSDLRRRGKGIAVQNISASDIESSNTCLAPFNEQRRIVSKLEELFSRLDAGVAALTAARVKLRRLRASVLKSAVEGRLTADWRAEHTDTEPAPALLDRILAERRTRWIDGQLAKWRQRKAKSGWTDAAIDEAAPAERTKLAAKYEEPKPPATDDLPELPATWCWVNGQTLFEWSSGDFLPKKSLRAGKIPVYGGNGINGYHNEPLLLHATLVVGRVGVHCGNVHLVVEPSWITDNAIYATTIPSAAHLPFLTTAFSQAGLKQQAQGGAQPFVNQLSLNECTIRLPPANEQIEIVRRVDEQLSRIDAAEKVIEAGLVRAKRLRQAILKRAFAGRLVPQDPSDEPASVLLERILAERAAAGANGKAARGATGGGDAPARSARKVPARTKKVPLAADAKQAALNESAAGPAKQLSLLGDEPASTTRIDPRMVAEAFRRTHDGWSTDYVIVSPEVNARFLDAAASLGVDASPRDVNLMLLNVRKTNQLGEVKPDRSYRLPPNFAPYEFVSEIAVAALRRDLEKEIGRAPSLDELLCNPDWAARLDQIAQRQHGDAESLPIRWAALHVRKQKKAAKAPEFGLPLRLSSAVNDAPDGPGYYRIDTPNRIAFIGFADSLADRLQRHVETHGKTMAAGWLLPEGERASSIALAPTPRGGKPAALAALIAAGSPWLNYNEPEA